MESQRSNAGPAANETMHELIQALSRNKKLRNITICIPADIVGQIDELSEEISWSRSRLVAKACKALLDGGVLYREIYGRKAAK